VRFLMPGRRDGPVLLPESALLSDAVGSFVYVIDPNDRVVRRDVVSGPAGNRSVAVRRGLAGDERVVLEAGPFLNPGQAVRPERARRSW